MITLNQFKPGKIVFYDDFAEKQFLKIKLLKITKKKGGYFWFDAEIVDNTNIPEDRREFYKIGTIHSFSNSFITESLAELKRDAENYKNTQIEFIKKIYGIEN